MSPKPTQDEKKGVRTQKGGVPAISFRWNWYQNGQGTKHENLIKGGSVAKRVRPKPVRGPKVSEVFFIKFFSTFSSREKNCLIGRSQLKKFATIWGLLYIFEGGVPPHPGGVAITRFDHVFDRFAQRIPSELKKYPPKINFDPPKPIGTSKKHENRRQNRKKLQKIDQIDQKQGVDPPKKRSSQK